MTQYLPDHFISSPFILLHIVLKHKADWPFYINIPLLKKKTMSDIEKQKLLRNYKLPAFTAVLVMLLIIVNACNNQGQSDKWQAENSKLIVQIEDLTSTTQQLQEQNGNLAALDKKIREQEKESVELSSAIGQMKAASKAASAALAYIERKAGKAKTRLEAIQGNISSRIAELAGLHNKTETLQRQIAANRNGFEQLQTAQDEKIKKSEVSYKETQLRFEKLSQEINMLEKAIVSKTTVLDSLELLNRLYLVIEKSIQVMTQDAKKKEIAQQARLEALQGMISEANAYLTAQQEKFSAMGKALDRQVQTFKITKHIRDDE